MHSTKIIQWWGSKSLEEKQKLFNEYVGSGEYSNTYLPYSFKEKIYNLENDSLDLKELPNIDIPL